MNRKTVLVGALAIIAGATAAWAAWTWYATRDEIPVVRTYADLLAQDPIVLADGTKVWLGKEAASCAVGSGVLVYVLEESASTQILSRSFADQVGPIRIRTRRGGERSTEASKQLGESRSETSSTTWLHTRRIDLTEPGSVQVEALTIEGKRLRLSRVRGESLDCHPWMHWGRWHVDLDTGGLVMGTALPCGPDQVSLRSDWKRRLPCIAPEEQSEALTIAKTGNDISIEAVEEMPILRSSPQFLTRFWVNGKAFVPHQSSKVRIQANGILHVKSFELNLDLPWSAIGARPGDRIGLQVLFCPNASWPPSDGTEVHATHSNFDDLGSPRLSNRIEFIAQ